MTSTNVTVVTWDRTQIQEPLSRFGIPLVRKISSAHSTAPRLCTYDQETLESLFISKSRDQARPLQTLTQNSQLQQIFFSFVLLFRVSQTHIQNKSAYEVHSADILRISARCELKKKKLLGHHLQHYSHH